MDDKESRILLQQLQATIRVGNEAGKRLRSFSEKIISERDRNLAVLCEVKAKTESGQSD